MRVGPNTELISYGPASLHEPVAIR